VSADREQDRLDFLSSMVNRHYSRGQYGHELIIDPLNEALYRTFQHVKGRSRNDRCEYALDGRRCTLLAGHDDEGLLMPDKLDHILEEHDIEAPLDKLHMELTNVYEGYVRGLYREALQKNSDLLLKAIRK
jgi:hypothetical protein